MTNIILIAVLTIAPAIILLYILYKLDSQKPEPVGIIIKTFLLGTLSVVVTLLAGTLFYQFEDMFDSFWIKIFIMSFVSAAFVEELSKLIVFKVVVYKTKDFNEVTDGIIYMAAISLAFAAVENFLYGMGGGMGVIIARAITAVPLHAIASGIMGYYVGREKMLKESGASIKGLLLAIFIHGIYNFFAFGSERVGEFVILLFAVLIMGGAYLFYLINKGLSIDREKNFS
ncbi:MAG: PrsW family intramembrane metalloprotease [Spirochaetota bacterium]